MRVRGRRAKTDSESNILMLLATFGRLIEGNVIRIPIRRGEGAVAGWHRFDCKINTF